jgi:hypothetical protein
MGIVSITLNIFLVLYIVKGKNLLEVVRHNFINPIHKGTLIMIPYLEDIM